MLTVLEPNQLLLAKSFQPIAFVDQPTTMHGVEMPKWQDEVTVVHKLSA